MEKVDQNRALIVVSLATSLSLFGDTALYTVLPTHFEVVGVALGSVGILLSANRFIRIFLNGPIGVLTDLWPRRRMLVPAVFLGGLSTAIYALSQSFWPLLVGRLLWGLAWAGIWVSGNAIILDISTARQRGKIVGRYQFAFFIGAAGGAFLGGALTDLIGFQWAMAAASTLTLIGAIVALLMLPETKDRRSSDPEPRGEGSLEEDHPDIPQLTTVTAMLGVNRLVVAGVMVATFGRLLAEKIGPSLSLGQMTFGVATLTGLALGASTLIGMVAAPVAGRLSDQYRSRWGVASGGLTFGLTGFSLLSHGTPAAILAGLPMVSLSSGSSQALSTALMGDLSPRFRHGRRLGLLFTVGDLASALGPLIAYALIPVIGLGTIYGFCAVLLGGMLLVALQWSRRTRTANIRTDLEDR
jgi:MFS family permease